MRGAGARLVARLVALRCTALAAAAGMSGLAGCTEINGAADHVAALEFSRLPYPAVVSGDTLRDSLGLVAPLHAVVFNSSGNEITNAEVQYLALDTGITIGANGVVVAQRRAGFVPLVASTTVLQTKAVNLLIARRPDSAAFGGTATDTIKYDILSPNSTVNNSRDLAVKVITRDTAGGITSTQGWLVSYQATFRGAAVQRGDTSGVFLLGDGQQRSTTDTTSSAGTASRRLRLNLIGLTPLDTDTALVVASVKHKGQHVRGSPLRFVILFRKKSP